MSIVIFSGTTEGRELSLRLAETGAAVTVCVATAYGEEEQPAHSGIRTLVGPLTPEEKQTLLRDALLCVDATHPYATHVTGSIRAACDDANVPYYRLLRPASALEDAVVVPDAAAAAAWLGKRAGNILLTTGAKELSAFAGLDPERLYPRVLPSHAALEACEALSVPHRNIIAMQGPFSRELNEAILRQYSIRFLVTKDGGAPGGFSEKAEAAKRCGVTLLVLRRPEETGMDFDAVLALCLDALGKQP